MQQVPLICQLVCAPLSDDHSKTIVTVFGVTTTTECRTDDHQPYLKPMIAAFSTASSTLLRRNSVHELK